MISDTRVTGLAWNSNLINAKRANHPLLPHLSRLFSHKRQEGALSPSSLSPLQAPNPYACPITLGINLESGCWVLGKQRSPDLLASSVDGLQWSRYLSHSCMQILQNEMCVQSGIWSWTKSHTLFEVGRGIKFKHNSQGYYAAVVSVVGLNTRKPSSNPCIWLMKITWAWENHYLSASPTCQRIVIENSWKESANAKWCSWSLVIKNWGEGILKTLIFLFCPWGQYVTF